MADPRWLVTIVDEDSEDPEKDEITQYEVRVTAQDGDQAKDRALAMIRSRVKEIVGHRLVIKKVQQIWKRQTGS